MGTKTSLRWMAVASAAAIVALTACSGGPPASTPATSSVVTTSLASLPFEAASAATETTASGVATDGLVPIEATGSDSDLVRDELPGYVAQALHAETYVLRRTYVPSDKATHDLLTIVAHRYVDARAADAAVAFRTKLSGVSALQDTPAAGLPGFSFVEAGETVLVLEDGSLVLDLRMRPGGRRADLRKALVGVAETLLD